MAVVLAPLQRLGGGEELEDLPTERLGQDVVRLERLQRLAVAPK